MSIKAGDAYWIKIGPGVSSHRCCILAVFKDPAVAGVQCSFVTITSVQKHKVIDKACLLDKDDHGDFIHIPSFAYYKMANIKSERQILAMINQGELEKHETPFSEEVLKRLRDGALKSEFAKQDVKDSIKLSGGS